MDAATASTVDSLVQSAMAPQQTREAVGVAVLDKAMDFALAISSKLMESMAMPPMDPSLGGSVDIYA